MKTFPSYDYTLCSSEDCSKRKSCARWLTYQKAINEKYPYTITVYKGSENNCNLYVKLKQLIFMKYHKINSLYKRDEKGKIIEGSFVNEIFKELYDSNYKFEYTEKVDGTNIRVIITQDRENSFCIEFRGKTDNAVIPNHLLLKLESLFYGVNWNKVFDWEKCSEVILYGEGFGYEIQKGGGNYNSKDTDFILFDVMIDGIFMRSEFVTDTAKSLNIKRVPILGYDSLKHIEKYVKTKPVSQISENPNFPMEGVVCRPIGDLKDRLDNRIIIKIKHKDYACF